MVLYVENKNVLVFTCLLFLAVGTVPVKWYVTLALKFILDLGMFDKNNPQLTAHLPALAHGG